MSGKLRLLIGPCPIDRIAERVGHGIHIEPQGNEQGGCVRIEKINSFTEAILIERVAPLHQLLARFGR